MIKIFDIEFEFDFADAECIEKIENQYKKTLAELEKIDKNKESTSSAIKKICEAINEFFDEILGKGASEKLFKGKYNFKKSMQALRMFMEERNKADEEINEELSYLNQYSSDRVKRD